MRLHNGTPMDQKNLRMLSINTGIEEFFTIEEKIKILNSADQVQN